MIAALVGTIAVIASGFDAQEVPRQEPSVWVARDAGQYARVNTETGEIDTVRKVSEPSGVVQLGAESLVLTNGNGRAWPVDSARTVDLTDHDGDPAEEAPAEADADADTDAEADAEADTGTAADAAATQPPTPGAAEPVRLPDGTREVLAAGKHLLLRTEAGAVYIGTLGADSGGADNGRADSGGANVSSPEQLAARLQSLQRIDPLAEEAAATAAAGAADPDQLGLRVDAIALSPDGTAALYSATDGTVWRFDPRRGDFVGGAAQVPDAVTGLTEPQFALVAGDWVLLDTDSGTLWREGGDSVTLQLAGAARLQASGEGDGQGAGGGTAALIADTSGLWRVPAQGDPERIAEATGTPAQPRSVDGTRYAAWLGQNSGVLWDSAQQTPRELRFDESARDLGEVAPVVYTNGDRAVLGEARSGMLWTLPEGRLIPLSQWTISDPPKEDQGTVVVDEVTEQVPPTARDDAFGVRQGEPAPLPVLLNDFDPNKRDVLTIVPESLGESPLPPDFGVVELMPDGQSLMVRPQAGATGSASFSYRITDGALASEAATVTLTVAPDDANTPPEWCPVEGCQRVWEVPPITPGGTLVYPILEGWVDPQGDPMMLAEVESLRPEDPVSAIVTADGRLALRHTDVNAGASELMLRLTVRDGRGAEQARDLSVAVQPGAVAEFQAMATTVRVGDPTVLRPLERVAGGSGSFQLIDVSVQSGEERVTAVARAAAGRIEVTASEAGEALLSLGVRDTVTGSEFTGVIRVTATPGVPPLTLPPLRAFVRPLADSTVDILHAIPGGAARAVSVSAANVVDGELRADVIEHSQVRVAGSTPDGGPGRVGAVDVTVTEGSAEAQGRLTVFQVPEAGAKGAVAVADTASVRAGAVVDIRVLDNDVAAPGERLILHPEVTGSGADGELAFASGSTLRYLAPKEPGTYRLSYTTYGASNPEAGDVGSVTVTVVPRGANQDPQPATLTARIAAGERARVDVPLSGVDPDGDRVRLIGVDAISDPQLTASLSASGAAIEVAASGQAAPGVTSVPYTVRDGEGGTGTGTLRIIVSPATEDSGAPIASSDYVRLVRGSGEEVAVRPLDNDIDPAHGTLEIVSVVPNLPGGEAHPDFQRAKKRLNLAQLSKGVVAIAPGDELGTISYRYTVKSSVSSSTAEGLLLAQTSERVGAQAPRITDTVLNVRERSELAQGGVDVITDKVRWAAGDPAALKLSLWEGNSGGYRVSGNSITGEYNPDGDLVAFELSGRDPSGAEVSSFGFLIIPPLDELRITLKPGLSPLTVDENKTVEASLNTLLDVTASDRVELAQHAFPVGRSQASCSAISADGIRYEAGSEAPWNDSCMVSVRLVGQKAWTLLPIPVEIVPRAPIAQLGALTRTVPPGETETIELTDMVQWQGNRAGDAAKLRFTASGGGASFDVQQSGSTLTVAASADATPGRQENVSISVAGAGESAAPLTLRVGDAPREQPRGGTINLSCTVGSDCAVDVIGAAGEYDPFAGKRGGGLKLETVSAAACSFGTVTKADERGVAVTWPDSRGPGGRCTVGFTVRDAQGRLGEGSIELDAQGVPRAPASLSLQSYTGSSVTFVAELGAAQSAHPAITGVEVSGAGSSSCVPAGPASYQCVVSGLENGAQHTFTARAVNGVGTSDPSSAATAWAYKSPEAPTVTKLESVGGPGITASTGRVEFSLAGGSDVARYSVSAGGSTEVFDGSNASGSIAAGVGNQTFTVVPQSRFAPPNGAPPAANALTVPVTVAGLPSVGSPQLSSAAKGQLTVSATGAGANFAPASSLGYTFSTPVPAGQTPAACSNDPAGYPAESTKLFTGLDDFQSYAVRVCVKNSVGVASSEIASGSPIVLRGEKPPVIAGPLSFLIDPDPRGAGSRVGEYVVAYEASPEVLPGLELRYYVDGERVAGPVHELGYVGELSVRQCLPGGGRALCSDPTVIEPAGAPTIVRAALTDSCVPVGDARAVVEVSAAARDSVSVTGSETGAVTLTWNGAFESLNSLTLQGTACGPPGEAVPGDPPPAP
ncbi:Ig-like domain-containing protein [Leucobacter sp. BZR 635]